MRLTVFFIFLFLAIFPAHAQEKISVLLDWFVNPDHAALIVAQERGMFAEAGLEVELIAPADPSAPPRLVAAGEVSEPSQARYESGAPRISALGPQRAASDAGANPVNHAGHSWSAAIC